jgi:hypothetical protein
VHILRVAYRSFQMGLVLIIRSLRAEKRRGKIRPICERSSEGVSGRDRDVPQDIHEHNKCEKRNGEDLLDKGKLPLES